MKSSREDDWALLHTLVALQMSLSRRFDGLDAGLGVILLADIALGAFFGSLDVKGSVGHTMVFPFVFVLLLVLPIAVASVGIVRFRADDEEPEATWFVNRVYIVDPEIARVSNHLPQAIERARSRYEENQAKAQVKEDGFIGALYLTLWIVLGFLVTWAIQAGPIRAILGRQ